MGASLALATEFIEENELDVNLQDTRNGKTALHYAVRHGSAEAITYLLSQGASKTIEDNKGKTPEQLALLLGSEAVKEAMGV
jgi:ankyrin repeat protein